MLQMHASIFLFVQGGWQQHYEYIKDKTGLELDKAVLDRLISECVMLIRDREEIDKPETQYKRNRVLLDILYNRPFPTFDIFIKVLVSVDPNHSDVESLQQRTRGSPDQCPYNRLPFANCKGKLHIHFSEKQLSYNVFGISKTNLFVFIYFLSIAYSCEGSFWRGNWRTTATYHVDIY